LLIPGEKGRQKAFRDRNETMVHAENGVRTSGKTLSFTKMCGHGNDFIVMSNMAGTLNRDWTRDARIWCRRKTGIGADGLLILEKSGWSDFRLRIFNADGSEAEMCGNGARCAASYAMEKNLSGESMKFETLAGLIEAEVEGRNVTIRLTDVAEPKKDLKVAMGKDVAFNVHFANSGVPHAVLFTETLDQLPDFRRPLKELTGEAIRHVGRLVRFHPEFGAAGTNVDFVEVAGPGHILVRTYERGVEEETLACGTGAVASAIVSSEYMNAGSPPICVDMPGGTLWVDFEKKGSRFESVRLKGPVQWIFQGEVMI